MADRDDMKKDVALGAAGVGMVVAGAPALPAVAIPATLGLLINAILGRDQRRAADLFHRLADPGEAPGHLAADLQRRLEQNDESTLSAFRALLVASLEAITPTALEPIALLGRQHLQGTCPPWVARGWLTILSQVTEVELLELRLLVAIAHQLATNEAPAAFYLSDLNDALLPVRPGGEVVRELVGDRHGDRLFSLLDRSGLSSPRWRWPNESRRALYLAKAVVDPMRAAFDPPST